MQSLLRWSIENSTPLTAGESRPPVAPKDLDPGIIDMILGRPDAELMKEDVGVAADSTRSEEDRVDALDHLEMLIEQIDNANNLAKLHLWEPLQSLLISDDATPSIKMHVLWVIGTAAQNNPSAQDAYLALNPLPVLTSCLTPSPSSTLQTRSKAIYALSGLLKHNAPAVKALNNSDIDGWPKLRDALQDPEITVRRKTAFLLATLLLPSTPTHTPTEPEPPHTGLHVPSAPSRDRPAEPVYDNSHAVHIKDPARSSTSDLTLVAFREHELLDAVISAITDPVPYGEDGDIQEADPAFEEQCIRLLYTYVVLVEGKLSESQRDTLRRWIEAEKKEGDKQLADRWSLDLQELQDLIAKVL